MKNIFLRCAILIYILGMGCNKYLDKSPISLITPDKVWNDPILIKGVIVSMYNQIQFEDFNYWFGKNWRNRNLATMSDEAQGAYQKAPAFDNANVKYVYEDEIFGNFAGPYKGIRHCNEFLEQLETAALDSSKKSSLRAEVRFIRAFQYFTLVKRYGGVPIIDRAQKYTGDNLTELQLPRSKEEEVYSFIIHECREAAKDLPLKRNGEGKYRATKGAALSLCSRAALYAGSIAKYGKVKLNGIIGIPANKADYFYEISYISSKKVIESGAYSLYNKYPEDKVKNFYELFQKGEGENNEYIFMEAFNAQKGKGHSFDKMNAPFSYRQGGWGCSTAPTLELVEAFDYKDGSEGTLKLVNVNGTQIKYAHLLDVFNGKDPRLFASIFVPGSTCKENKMIWQRGLIDSKGNRIQATKQPNESQVYKDDVTGKIYKISGKDGGADVGDASKTGFYQRKFWDRDLKNVAFDKSDNPWPVFRLAEMYLNLAEAAVEMGKHETEALNAINKIRERAGIALLSSINVAKVRHERRVELAFEGQRYWDMHRWRIAGLDVSKGGLNGFRGTALYPWLDTRDNKYIFERGHKPPKEIRVFLPKNYYVKIPASAMNSDPKMVQNPGYTN